MVIPAHEAGTPAPSVAAPSVVVNQVVAFAFSWGGPPQPHNAVAVELRQCNVCRLEMEKKDFGAKQWKEAQRVCLKCSDNQRTKEYFQELASWDNTELRCSACRTARRRCEFPKKQQRACNPLCVNCVW